MPHNYLPHLLEAVSGRAAADGGLAAHRGGPFNPEATAWGAIALRLGGVRQDLTLSCLEKLSTVQSSDGRVSRYGDHPESFWPTPLAVLAWRGSEPHLRNLGKGVDFLLANSGRHWKKPEGYPCDYDTSIRGWPWAADAHSWVEPTSLALLALDAAGKGDNPRFSEGARMLLDRQLPHGGWNFGITLMYGHEIPPQAHLTGIALAALKGYASPDSVKKSIDYLKTVISETRAPLSLCWSILGLSAWGLRPSGVSGMIAESLLLQQKYGEFDTSIISLLVIAMCAEEGLKRAMA